ncbi:MAG: phosphatidylserine/phosphatidylglycerophosphate/cardiolipin synthase family protein [Chloroflexi bacterium]|nr:phosphatidylserine/phosphatidylglycerophosphate/cardiolipin synthase family protein [Chloroflexota bacterium]
MATWRIARRVAGNRLWSAFMKVQRRRNRRERTDWAPMPYGGKPAWWTDDPHWYPADTPPRRHNRLTPLIDGAEYFSALLEALDHARHYVYIAGWSLTPYMPLQRERVENLTQTRVYDILHRTAQRVPVRLLLWGGAPLLLEPSRSHMLQVQAFLQRHIDGDFRCLLDHTAGFTHCHHQKVVVIDGQLAFIGGLDWTTIQGDRWDHSRHPLRAGFNWHDVQVKLEGEAVADVDLNFHQRWEAVSGGERLASRPPVFDPAWQLPVQTVRTIRRATYPFAPQGITGIEHAYLTALRRARRLIYLENQYLWSPRVMQELLAHIHYPPSPDFRIVIVLPAWAENGKLDNDRHVKRLQTADPEGRIVSCYCPYTSGPSAGASAFLYRPIYVHAKVGIVDDEWVLIGSANLNERGLESDSELDVLAHDADFAGRLRTALWSEHLALPTEHVAQQDPVHLIDEVWKRQARENAAIVREGGRMLISAVHPYVSGQIPGSWLLGAIESVMLEI